MKVIGYVLFFGPLVLLGIIATIANLIPGVDDFIATTDINVIKGLLFFIWLAIIGGIIIIVCVLEEIRDKK